MASTTLSKISFKLWATLGLLVVSSLAIAQTPPTKTSAQCIGEIEGSSSYNSKPSALGHQGKYQMGVAAMIDAGFCARTSRPTQTENQTQLWQNCILTQKGRDNGLTANADGTLNIPSFIANGAAQETAFTAYKAQNRIYAADLYANYTGSVINGTVMTEEVIDYLVHHGGAAGARDFFTSNGQHCRPDRAANSSLCQSAKKMSDCMNGTTTTGGGSNTGGFCV